MISTVSLVDGLGRRVQPRCWLLIAFQYRVCSCLIHSLIFLLNVEQLIPGGKHTVLFRKTSQYVSVILFHRALSIATLFLISPSHDYVISWSNFSFGSPIGSDPSTLPWECNRWNKSKNERYDSLLIDEIQVGIQNFSRRDTTGNIEFQI